jgi:hypothetical protein
MDEAGVPLSGTKEHIYYMPPLYFLLLSRCYKIFNLGLFQTRFLSAGFGLLLFAAWFAMLRALRVQSAAWFVLALALDSGFVLACSREWMDLECAAPGTSAIAANLTLRGCTFLLIAVLASSSLIVLSGLIHPFGVFCLIDTVALKWLDRERWSWRPIMFALALCIRGATAWGTYILEDPADFVRQSMANATMAGRLEFVATPLRALHRTLPFIWDDGTACPGLITAQPGERQQPGVINRLVAVITGYHLLLSCLVRRSRAIVVLDSCGQARQRLDQRQLAESGPRTRI